ncbi:MAG: pyridoxal phosphate-dependent aminotransferase [Candidatus Bathyarchaeia archaeon]|nr:pyridoxal phosphate-dependent aminotransferase [Candidatus Bathyarchaeota archaeon]
MKLSKRMDIIKPSGTIAMAEKARELSKSGRRILNLDVGEPDFDTPEHIKRAAIEALMSGHTHYTSSLGTIELRRAIAEYLKRRRNVDVDPEKEIIITPGAKHAIYCACMATLDPGDEVLVLAPTWPTHFTCIEAAGATPVEVPCGEAYRVDEEMLKEKITSKTKMILINSPNNPTGGVLNVNDMRVIADLAADHRLLVLSDEIYDEIVYDGIETKSMLSFDNIRENVIVINGFSKTYAMTGWRLGYAIANKDVIDAMNRLQQATTTCPANFVQVAGVAALKGPRDEVEKMVGEFNRRRKYIVKALNEIPGVRCVMPKGAFYVFPRFYGLKMSSFEVSMKLLEEECVSTTPGSAFGACGEGHIRISYATSIETIAEAIERIKRFVEKYSTT